MKLSTRVQVLRYSVLAGLCVLTLGLFQTQVVRGKYYRGMSENNRIRLIRLEAPRGNIYDRNRVLLATNRPAYNVHVIPEDFDSHFFNTAHPNLTFDRYLEGGEPVQVVNACRNGRLSFQLPVYKLQLKVKIAGGTEEPVPNLETVLIEPDENRLCLVWRASVLCDKKALKVEEVGVELQEMQPAGQVS